MKDFSNFTINHRETIRNTFKKQDLNKEKFIIVVDNDDKAVGIVTDGDFRRAIWNSVSLEDTVDKITNKNFVFFLEDYNIEKAKSIFLTTKIRQVPILRDGKIIDIIFYNDFVKEGLKISKAKLDIPVVIMAGGMSTRLEPISKILPKPLIPLGDRTIIEIIIDEFRKQGAEEYYLTLNHKNEMIELYLNSIKKDYRITCIKEADFWGTAGSLRLLQDKISNNFIVSNCDVIVKTDFAEVLCMHREKQASLTVISSIQHYILPYGVVKFKENGEVIDIIEKPEHTFTINAGAYVLNREALRIIPEKKRFDMTDLAKALIKNNKKVIAYPVNENDYLDIGQLEEYKRTLEKLQLFR